MDHSIHHFVDLVSTLSISDATNVLLVVEGLRPATLLVIDQRSRISLNKILHQHCDREVGFVGKKNINDKKCSVIVYNKTFFDLDQVQKLSQDKAGMGKLLGYIASSDEMGIQSNYKIEYRVNEQQLYAQVCKYLDDDRIQIAEEQLKRYQEIGKKLGLEITLYFGERETQEGRPIRKRNDRQRIWIHRKEIADCLEKNFPRTAEYFRDDDPSLWLVNWRRYHDLWMSIVQFKPDVEVPNLEMSLYQRWKLRSKTRQPSIKKTSSDNDRFTN